MSSLTASWWEAKVCWWLSLIWLQRIIILLSIQKICSAWSGRVHMALTWLFLLTCVHAAPFIFSSVANTDSQPWSWLLALNSLHWDLISALCEFRHDGHPIKPSSGLQLAVYPWSPSWAYRRVAFLCDNEVVVSVLQTMSYQVESELNYFDLMMHNLGH